jgi:hypothetical protein
MAISVVQQGRKKGSQIVESATGLPVWIFDATINEDHDTQAEATDHEVDEDSEISDHVQLKAFTLSLTGVITNTPWDAEADPARVQQTYRLIRELIASKQLVTVTTGLESYPDMVCLTCSASRGQNNGLVLKPTVTFRQIRIAKRVLVAVPAVVIAADKRNAKASAQKEKDAAALAIKKAQAAQAAQITYDSKKDALSNIGDAFAKFKTGGLAALPGGAGI